MMGVFPQSFNKTLQADDVKSGFLEKLCQVLGKDMSFFYGNVAFSESDEINKELVRLREENAELRKELRHREDPERYSKESEVYDIWMEYMKVEELRMNLNNRMLSLYQKQKEK
jgi:hypothetical protein